MRRSLRIGLCSVTLAIAVSAPIRRAHAAEPTKEECLDDYKKNQQLRREGALREAIKQLLVCARNPCPAVLQPECVDWLRDATARLPTIIVKAHSSEAADLTDVSVTLDGAPLVARLEGRAIDVDPGMHTLVFSRPGARSVEKKLLFVEREKDRVIDVDFSPPAQASAATASTSTANEADGAAARRPVPWTFYALGGIGLAALGTGATFGTLGLMGRSDLSSCTGPRCPDDKDAVARKFLIADISYAVGAVAIVAAAVVYLTRQPVSGAAVARSAP